MRRQGRRPVESHAGAALFVSVVLVLGSSACVDGCRPEQAPHVEPKAWPLASEDCAVLARDISLKLDPAGRASAALRDGEGSIHYLLDDGGCETEEVVAGAVPSRPALDHFPSGEPVIAALVQTASGPAPPIAALAESPKDGLEGEGDLVLLMRRGTALWRYRPVASRAMAPSIVAAEQPSVHLGFLQRTADGRFAVVYVRVDGRSIAREQVATGALGVPPHLAVVEGRPVMTWVGEGGGGGPVVMRARAGATGIFEAPVSLPASILGEPPRAPEALAWIPEEGGGLLALVRPVEGGRLSLPERGRVRLDPRAEHALVLARFEGEDLVSATVHGTSRGGASMAGLAIGAPKMLGGLAARAGALPLVLGRDAPESEPLEKESWAPRLWLMEP